MTDLDHPTGLEQIFRGVSKQMEAHFAAISKSFGHAGEQGASNERVLARFLSDFLPRRYALGHGKIITPDKHVSDQIDIIIYDAFNCPPIYTEEGFCWWPLMTRVVRGVL